MAMIIDWIKNLYGSLRWRHEMAFWDQWLRTRGKPWPLDYQFRCDPHTTLQHEIVNLIEAPQGASVQILDVGAGPLTYLGKCWPGRTVQICAIDPLAEKYDQLLQKYAIQPVVRTQTGWAERLLEQFPPNHFDLVHARNCIDHSHDPCLAIEQMVAVVKPGGVVYMHHIINEGKLQHYHGLHQWNLYDQMGELYVSNRQQIQNMTARLHGIARVTNQVYGSESWLVTCISKFKI